MQALVVNPPTHTLPDGTTDLVYDIGWSVTTADDYRAAIENARTGDFDAVILREPSSHADDPSAYTEFNTLMRVIDSQRIATLMLSDNPAAKPTDSRSLVEVVGCDIPRAELRGRLAMIERYHGLLRLMERELHSMEKVSRRLSDHFHEMDQELQLAGRLQRDFLPDLRKPIGNIQFATLYRPASWVSGDMFDVFRIDETHTGIYLADAVGHGMAASLLTMFIKRAITPKRVDGDSYTIVSPSDIMRSLNDALADQELPNCQFVTAWYGLINHETLTMEYARGGHPYPMLATADGIVSELKSPGGLLGISPGMEFTSRTTQLQPGDKVLIYTDGVELAFQGNNGHRLDSQSYRRVFESLASRPIEEIIRGLEDRLDDDAESDKPRDDVTVVGMEILPRRNPALA